MIIPAATSVAAKSRSGFSREAKVMVLNPAGADAHSITMVRSSSSRLNNLENKIPRVRPSTMRNAIPVER